MLPSKDANFVGYTYKNFEIVNDDEVAGIGQHSLSLSNEIVNDDAFLQIMHFQCLLFEKKCCAYGTAELKKKSSKSKRPTIKTLFGIEHYYYLLVPYTPCTVFHDMFNLLLSLKQRAWMKMSLFKEVS